MVRDWVARASRFGGMHGYRTILVSTFGALLALALASAGLARLGAGDARYELERTRLAHEVLEAHIQLEAQTYALFKQLTDTFLADGASKLDETAARARLLRQIDTVRGAIAREVSFVGDREDEGRNSTASPASSGRSGGCWRSSGPWRPPSPRGARSGTCPTSTTSSSARSTASSGA